MGLSLVIPEELRKQLVEHAGQCFPEEACGLIGGVAGEARLVCPVENELHSPVRFRMAPLSQLKAFLQMDKYGVELLGIFHSHPTGPDGPSQTDIAEFYYPGTPVVILSPGPTIDLQRAAPPGNNPGDWQIKGFLIENDRFVEIELKQKI